MAARDLAQWKTGPHLLTYRQLERTFGLVVRALAKHTPDGTPSKLLREILDRLLETSVQICGEPASSSYAVDWTDQETWSRPPPKRGTDADGTDPNNAEPVPDSPEQHAPQTNERCADPEASWGHRRGNHPGQKDEAFYGYYLQAATIVKDEHGPDVPELVRRIHIASCDHDPPPALVPTLQRMVNNGITISDLLADSGYAYRVPENWALPVRQLGANPIHDLHPTDQGTQGTHQGAIRFNGRLYCPATPKQLLDSHRCHAARAASKPKRTINAATSSPATNSARSPPTTPTATTASPAPPPKAKCAAHSDPSR